MLFRRIVVAVGAAALVTIPAAAAHATDLTPPSSPCAAGPRASLVYARPSVDGPRDPAAGEPSAQDAAFLHAANEINLAEIAHGRIAFTKSRDAEVKKIAGRFMVDHIRLNAEISEAARALKVRLAYTPNAAHQALADRYEAAPGGSFDALYLSTQLELQQEADRIAGAQIAKGTDTNLKRVATASTPVLAEHQRLLKDAIS